MTGSSFLPVDQNFVFNSSWNLKLDTSTFSASIYSSRETIFFI